MVEFPEEIHFLWEFTNLKIYAKLQHIIKIALILLHGQAQVKSGFSSKKSLINGYMSTGNIVTLCSVHGYLTFHDLKAHEAEMIKELLESCRQGRKKYFDDHRSKTLSVEKTENGSKKESK